MNITVAGCGKIGETVIASLIAEGHDITAIDKDRERINEIVNIYDIIGVCGGCVDHDTLLEANIGETDIFIATTASDESNMLSCFFAKSLGAKHTMARIRETDYNDSSLDFIKHELGLSMTLNPEYDASREIFNLLRLPSAVNIETFSNRAFEIIEMKLKPDSPLDSMTLSEIRDKYKAVFLVCAVLRGSSAYIPDGNFVLHAGDRIGVIAAPNEMQKLLKKVSHSQKQAKNIMILGGSRTAYYLAKKLSIIGSNVKIIENDENRCVLLSEVLSDTSIIHGNGSKQEILLEEGLLSMDAFVALTGLDEENIIMSVFAASKEVPKVISKVNREEFSLIAGSLGLDSIVTPSKLIANKVVRYLRALENARGSKVESLYKLMDGEVEALEFTVSENFIGNGIPLKDLSLKKNILIAGIVHARKNLIPTGSDCINAGDKVIVISCEKHITDLSDILR